MKEYLNSDSKSKHFYYHKIETKGDFDKYFKETKYDCNFLFRGVNEAKYKLFTSAQRKWITEEISLRGITFVDFIDDLLSNIKNNHTLSEYFKSKNIPTNDILYLSFLQHYGAPTPLLDFTSDKNIAFYFALKGLNTKTSGESGIENYFSIYALQLTNDIPSIDRLFQNAIKDGTEMIKSHHKEYPDQKINSDILKRIDLLTPWKKKEGPADGLYAMHLAFIPNPSNSVKVLSTAGQPLLWSNLNIIAQKGCFIMNSNEAQPLEEIMENNTEFKRFIRHFE